jgi:hypothetical protein
MGWAVTVEGRSDPGGIVLLLDDRSEAESIADEIRNRGTRVVVKLYAGPGRPLQPASGSSPPVGRPGSTE